jgi:hypothetical protein
MSCLKSICMHFWTWGLNFLKKEVLIIAPSFWPFIMYRPGCSGEGFQASMKKSPGGSLVDPSTGKKYRKM